MRVSQRLDYTLRLLTAISRLPQGERVAVGELAEAMSLPRRFCEQQITELSRHDIVSCRRGAGGGCRLEVPADELSVVMVVNVLQGSALDVPHTPDSATAEMWEWVADSVERLLADVTIADLAQRQSEIELAGSPMYHI